MGKQRFVMGIDEAGRGPLAGPVVVAGIKIATCDMRHATRFLRGIKDSKKLTARQRDRWFGFLTGHPKVKWATAKISPKVIDRINIARAANLGARRVYGKLACGTVCPAVLDGSLYLSKKVPHETVIRGDEKIPVISAASIIAKVTRDRIMRCLHKKYPQYGFDVHKGYGTKLHREKIGKFGRCGAHRESFAKTWFA